MDELKTGTHMRTELNERSRPKANARWVKIYDAIKMAILSHNLIPGMKLPEDEIGEVYSVSRTVVRSALHALAHDKLVVLEPNRGAFVSKPSKREAREVFEARSLIEPRVAALAAESATQADVRRLEQNVKEEHKTLDAGRNADAVLLSAKFHVTIAEIADQWILREFVAGLCTRSALIISIHWKRQSAFCESVAHEALVRAISEKDPDAAARLMASHLDDLLSGIDVNEKEEPKRKFADILRELSR